MNTDDEFQTVLRARIALLATAIGGPDYNSELDPPPYKIGDDCLACLKDLKRWFKFVDEQQKRWDVAMAAAEYRILTDDILPILIDWENQCSLAAKLKAKASEENVQCTRNKEYNAKIALNCLQLLVIMTWPLILTDQSTENQVKHYTELKKYQLIYKKSILTMGNGKALKAAVRLAVNVIKIEKINRTAQDYMTIKIVLKFLRNVAAIEPEELTITPRKRATNKGITTGDMLPSSVTYDDISLNSTITSFQRNKVFDFLLTVSSNITTEFDQDFVNIPLMEIMFYLTKNVNPNQLHSRGLSYSKAEGLNNNQVGLSSVGLELTDMLKREEQLKRNLIKHTSSRHSKFGAMISIQTPDNGRLTISGTQTLLSDDNAMEKLDKRKKWNKRKVLRTEEKLDEGLTNSLLNSQTDRVVYLQEMQCGHYLKFLNDFIDSSFNNVLRSITNLFTSEYDSMTTMEQIQYLLFYGWFTKYQVQRVKSNPGASIDSIYEALAETPFTLISTLLRSSCDLRNWIVVHSGMIAFNELLVLIGECQAQDTSGEVDYIMSRLFSNERIQLLSSIPKIASKQSLQFIKNCVELNHTVLKILENYASKQGSLGENDNTSGGKKKKFTQEDVDSLADKEDLSREEAYEILLEESLQNPIVFTKVQKSYLTEAVVNTYVNLTLRFREIGHEHLKRCVSFFHRLFIQAKEESLLYRMDFILLLRDILSSDGLPRNSRIRMHFEEFSKYYLARLRKRFKSSPAWYVGILFSGLHSSDVGYFQRYGEIRQATNENFYGLAPSIFRRIEDEEMLPGKVVTDMKYGILVSTLLDDGKEDILSQLLKHMKNCFAIFSSWYAENNNGENYTAENLPSEILVLENVGERNPLLFDRDFRALLVLVGYSIPKTRLDKCFLNPGTDLNIFEEAIKSIEKYMLTAFETPNNQLSSTYLIRKSEAEHDSNDTQFVNNRGDTSADLVSADNREVGDESYFRELDQSVNRKSDKHYSVGIAKSSKRNNKRSNLKKLPFNGTDDGEKLTKKQHHQFYSKELISDSEDEDEHHNPIFFENEMYMRWLLDKHQGLIPPEKFAEFGKFTNERIEHNGRIVSDFSDLFGGNVPDLTSLQALEINKLSPDRTLIQLAQRHDASRILDQDSSAEEDGGVRDDASENLEKTQNNITAGDVGSNSVLYGPADQQSNANTLRNVLNHANEDTSQIRAFKRRKLVIEEDEESE